MALNNLSKYKTKVEGKDFEAEIATKDMLLINAIDNLTKQIKRLADGR